MNSLFSNFTYFQLLLLAIFSLPISTANSQDTANTVWDLTDLYATEQQWLAEHDLLEKQIEQLAKAKDSAKMAKSSSRLFEQLSLFSSTLKTLSRFYIYASLRNDENQNIAHNQQNLAKARALYSRFSEATSWMTPAIVAIGGKKIERFIKKDKRLKPFDFYLRDIIRQAEHTRSEEVEQVLAAGGIVMGSPNGIYELLVNADIPWPTIVLSTGESVYLDQAAYSKHRASPNRQDRKLVFDSFWNAWGEFEDSLGAILSTEVNANVFNSKVRHYDDTLSKELSDENIPPGVYRTLVAEVNAGLPTLHRYFKLRARMLGIEDLGYHDIYPALVELDKTFDLKTSEQLTEVALQPFGEEYSNHLKTGLQSPWSHVYPAKGKRSGAYVNGAAYDVHPYVLLNHNDDYDSLSTFAHEWGHAVHSLFSNQNQPYEKAGLLHVYSRSLFAD